MPVSLLLLRGWMTYVELLVGVILGNILGVEGRAGVAGDQVASETGEALFYQLLVFIVMFCELTLN